MTPTMPHMCRLFFLSSVAQRPVPGGNAAVPGALPPALCELEVGRSEAVLGDVVECQRVAGVLGYQQARSGLRSVAQDIREAVQCRAPVEVDGVVLCAVAGDKAGD